MKIAFFLGSVDISGGSYVVYQHAHYLKKNGFDVSIIVLYPYNSSQLEWHPAIREFRIIPITDVGEERFDLVFATWWKTALELHQINSYQYAYFVQSIESRFYPESEVPLRNLVDSTYSLPLPGVTEAVWIKNYIDLYYGQNYWLVRNGIRKDIYTSNGSVEKVRAENEGLRVLVEGPFGVFFKNVGRTIKLARKSKSDDIWLLTSSDIPWYPLVDRVFSRVPINRVPDIYRSCDVLVKLSYVEGMFGPPLEIFHCGGTSIVYDVTGYDEYIVHDYNALVVERDDEEGVVRAINKLHDDQELLERLKNGAMKTANDWPDWDEASAVFLNITQKIMSLPAVSREAIAVKNQNAQIIYDKEEICRLSKNPSNKLYKKADILLDNLPDNISRSLRLGRYILEGFI